MAFLSPLFLIGALAAAIPLAIHLFHRRTEPVVAFAAMRYLRRTPVEDSRWRRVKELLLLALRVAATLLLAFAFARPYLPGSANALSAATIVLVDTSASMSAPGVMDRARAAAREAIRSAPPGQAVGVMTFAQAADVLAPLSEDRAGADAALERLSPGAGATRYRAALARAAEQFGDRPGRIIVVTDLQQNGWDAADEGSLPDRVSVEPRGIAAPGGNLALAALRVEGADAIATVQSFSAADASTQVAFAIDGHTVGNVPITIPARGTADARFTLGARASGALAATVADRDGSVADNVRYAVLDATAAPSVLGVSASGREPEFFYLERALSIGEGAGTFRFRGIGGLAFSALRSEDLSGVDVIAILGTRGLDQRGRELIGSYVRGGGGLFVTAGPQVDPAILASALNGTIHSTLKPRDGALLAFAPDDGRHPVFRPFGGVGTLSSVSFTHAALVTAGDGAEVVAKYSDGTPALVEEQVGDGRALVFASDLNHEWNDFPLQPAFVPFVHEALRYLAATRASRPDYMVGDVPGPDGARPGVVTLGAPGRSPGAAPAPRTRPVASTSSGPPSGFRTRRVAVNVDPREFDPAVMDSQSFAGGVRRMHVTAANQAVAVAQDREGGQRLWQVALLLMVVSLAAEGALGKRIG